MALYSAFANRVRGYAHTLNDKPCQDAYRIDSEEEYLVVSLADGHGGEKYLYSHEGAQLAVETANAFFVSLFEEEGQEKIRDMLCHNGAMHLPRRIEAQWKNKVQNCHNAEERETSAPGNIYELYGTTLLCVAACAQFIFAMQIGDGDILFSYRENGGDAAADRIMADESRPGGETYSLCMQDCWKYFNTYMVEHAPDFPDAIILSTDGYANSFISDDGFLQAGRDYMGFLMEKGPGYIKENLPGWLENASRLGSGDDITAAVIYRCDFEDKG